MSFWNSGPTYHSAGVAILFSENLKGKIQNIVNDNAGRIISYIYIEKANFPYNYTVWSGQTSSSWKFLSITNQPHYY